MHKVSAEFPAECDYLPRLKRVENELTVIKCDASLIAAGFMGLGKVKSYGENAQSSLILSTL